MLSLIIPTLGTREEELHRLLKSIEGQSYDNYELIIVSQDNHEVVDEIISGVPIKEKCNHVRMNKKGLSIARNEGMKYVKGDIVTFSDDDCWYPPEAFANIVERIRREDAGAMCFQIFDPLCEQYYKDYGDREEQIDSIMRLFNVSSIEIFINLNKIDRKHVSFDERFGVGGIYPSGEENIFLTDLFKKGYQINYVPEIVVYHKKKSLAQIKMNDNQIIGKGALFRRIFSPPVALILTIAFVLKKNSVIENPIKGLFYASIKSLKFKP
ncbi:glycosyltransferase family 2 protein [Bacillus kexueae]|uniref:glycosyltransferase family 2 protein n=1 Tax=Aeribacillus kexueae TaxID=2078952 RepID=UPI001FAFE990|nr:glycosyltransferase family 2 protein [Bacillus kexueae]